jgi:hypothetical protein
VCEATREVAEQRPADYPLTLQALRSIPR